MAATTTERGELLYRDVDTLDGMAAVEDLQQQIWGFSDREVVPAIHLRAVTEVGGILLGAYDDGQLVGFAYAFPACEGGRVEMHSDMLGVKPGYRDRGIGYCLKLLQRERALRLGVEKITWTFDPLLSRNAYFNIAKLGVRIDSYRTDFYGRAAWSAGLTGGTDRLWASWDLRSRHVRRRLEEGPAEDGGAPPGATGRLLECTGGAAPRRSAGAERTHGSLSIEIPAEPAALMADPCLLTEWRSAVRGAFEEAFARKYVVTGYRLIERGGRRIGVYVLQSGGD